MPTTATAFAPRRATKKMSTIANKLSANISTIIGTARMKIACLSEPSVKSRCEPQTASFKIAKKELSTVPEDGVSLLDIFSFCLKELRRGVTRRKDPFSLDTCESRSGH